MKPAAFHLTRHAARCLREIHVYSAKQWGTAVADRYLTDVYAVMRQIVAKPSTGQLRARRSAPFLMAPARDHFIVYDRLEGDVVILAVLHQCRDIERIVDSFRSRFVSEIAALRKRRG